MGLSLVLFLTSKDNTPARQVSSSPEIDVIKSMLTDYEQGNWENWKRHYTDTATVFHNSTRPMSVDELQGQLSSVLDQMSSYGFQEKDRFYEMVIEDQGEKWVNFWAVWEGKFAANGETLIVPVHLNSQFEGGKIVEEHAYYNLAPFAAAMAKIEAARQAGEGITAE